MYDPSPLRRRRALPSAAAAVPGRRHVRADAGDARPDHRRHRPTPRRGGPARHLAVPVGRHRLPRPRDGDVAALRPAVGPLRPAQPPPARHGAVPGRVGAGGLESLSFILMADLYAGRRNAALQGAMAGMMGVAFIAGPLIGGFLTDHVGWRACFTVNLPIGVAAMAVIASTLPASIGRSE